MYITKHMRKAASIYILFVFFFISIISMISTHADADLLTTVTAQVDQDEQSVDVSPGSTGSVVYTGIVEAESINTATPLIVELWAETSVGSAILDKPSMIFQGNQQSDTFQIVVTVPLDTSASEDHTGTVSGTWTQGGRTGEVEGDTFKLIVLPYYYPNLSCKSPMRNVTRGESITFEMLLNNSGNIDDVFHVEVENREELEEMGIKINDIDDMPIAERGFEEFEIRVSTSDDSPVNKIISIHLVTTSVIGEEPIPDYYSIVINIREKDLLSEIIFNPMVIILIVVVIIVAIVVYMKKR